MTGKGQLRFAALLAALALAGCHSSEPSPAGPTATQPVATAATAVPPGAPVATATTAPPPAGTARRDDPAAHASRAWKDITYCTAGGVDLKADIYAPNNASGPAALVVYVHGGAWVSGDKASGAGARDIPALLDAGFAVAGVNYRLAPDFKFPAMIEDVKCAIRFFRANAAAYGFDPARIGAWGGSAGGHLVSLLGLAGPSAGFDTGQYADYSSAVQAVVDMFGPADLTVDFAGAAGQLRANVFGSFSPAAASPVTYASPGDPPFLILHGDQDNVVPLAQSQRLLQALQAAGVPAELVVVQHAGHSFAQVGPDPISPSREQITQRVVAFFQEWLR